MIRLGVVPYLNILPLVEGLDGAIPRASWTFGPPRRLAEEVRAGRLDIGIGSLFETLQEPALDLLPGAAIGCDGPVLSVQWFSRVPLAESRRVLLDRASLTSIHLARILGRDLLGHEPEWVLSDAPLQAEDDLPDGFDGAVAIGDTALRWAIDRRFPHALDLGEGWKRLTGLPFVFAGWSLRPGFSPTAGIAEAFRTARKAGEARIDAIAARSAAGSGFTEAQIREYLGRHIRYGFGSEQQAAVEEFRFRLAAHGLLGGVLPSAAAGS